MVIVYTIEFQGYNIDHLAILTLNSTDSTSGTLYHVTGDIRRGFVLDIKYNYRFRDSITYIRGSRIFICESRTSTVERAVYDTPPPSGGQRRRREDCRTWVRQVIRKL
jgi:hypothetical protein